MQLVLGLGNPGPRYAATRHNIGARCVEAAAARLGLEFRERQPQYLAATGPGPGGPVTFLLPLTFMNRSGEALLAWTARVGLEVVPIVVCDDLQLPLGSVRIRGSGSDGGQKGLASVIEASGGAAVPRLRLGVGRLGEAVPVEVWAEFVLQPFADEERAAVDELVERGADALIDLLARGWEAAGARHNRRVQPPAGSPDPLDQDG